MNFEETNSSLKFAQRAKKIKNKPLVNEVLDDKALIKKYESEIEELKRKLEVAQQAEKQLEELQHIKSEKIKVEQDKEKIEQELEKHRRKVLSLQEKIRQLTKMILVSSSVDEKANPRIVDARSRRRSFSISASNGQAPSLNGVHSNEFSLVRSADFSKNALADYAQKNSFSNKNAQGVDQKEILKNKNEQVEVLTRTVAALDQEVATLKSELLKKDEELREAKERLQLLSDGNSDQVMVKLLEREKLLKLVWI